MMWNVVCHAFIYCCLVVLFGCNDGTNEQAQGGKHYEKAVSYLENKDPDSALIELKNAIQLNPLHSAAYYQLGRIYQGEKEYTLALQQFLRASSLNPDNVESHYLAANIYFAAGSVKESRDFLDKALQVNPDHFESLLLAVNIVISEGDYEQAERMLVELSGSGNKKMAFFLTQARLAMMQGKSDRAETFLFKALELEPANIMNQLALISIYVGEKNYGKLETHLLDLTQQFPGITDPWLALSSLYRKQRQTDKELKAIEAALSIREDVTILKRLAQYYIDSGSYELAYGALDRAQPFFEKPEDEQVIRAGFYISEGRIEEAEKLIQKVLVEYPKNHSALLLHAKLLTSRGNLSEAVALLDQLLVDEPDWAEALVTRGQVLLQLNRLELALNDSIAAFRAAPQRADVSFLLARISFFKKDFVQARYYAGNVLRANPQHMGAILLGGQSLLELQEYEQALGLFTLLDEDASGNIMEFQYYKAAALAGTGQREEALSLLDTILVRQPDNTAALSLFLQVKAKQGQLGEAIARIKEQTFLVPGNAGHKVLLANFYEKQGDWPSALAIYSDLYEGNPSPSNGVQLAKVMVKTGDSDKAEKLFAGLLENNPQLLPALYGLALLKERKGDKETAQQLYEEILAIQPESPFAANNLAWLLSNQNEGDLGEALRLAMYAVKMRPEDASMADTLGWVHYRRGSFTLAESLFLQALVLDPGNSEYGQHLQLVEQAGERKARREQAEIRPEDFSLGMEQKGEVEVDLEKMLQQQ